MIIPITIDKWHEYEPYLIKACRKQKKPESLVIRLYRLCLEEECFVYGNDEDKSFAIVSPKIDPNTLERVMFIWAAYGINGERGRNEGFLEELARGMGAKHMEFWSKREGFKKTGWEVMDIIYRKEVGHGRRR